MKSLTKEPVISSKILARGAKTLVMRAHNPALGLALTGLLASSLAQAEIGSVADLRWDHRVVLIESNHASSPEILALQAEQAALAERDIAWFALNPISNSLSATNYSGTLNEGFAAKVAQRYKLDDPERRYVLIGKDGGEKDAGPRLNFDRLYSLIDAMPMRQREMARSD
ncbi:MAG: DUF4174 domain-containing protein [Oceanobacter sp.]